MLNFVLNKAHKLIQSYKQYFFHTQKTGFQNNKIFFLVFRLISCPLWFIPPFSQISSPFPLPLSSFTYSLVVCHCGMLTLWQCGALNNWCVYVKVWCLTCRQIEPAGSKHLPISQLPALCTSQHPFLYKHRRTHTHLSTQSTYLPVASPNFFSQTCKT